MGSHMRWAAAKRSLIELEGQPTESWPRPHRVFLFPTPC